MTNKQRAVLNEMIGNNWYSAYNLQCSISTLNALHKAGLVEGRCDSGYLHSPRTSIMYRRIK